jgi:ABC-type transport system involved in cytochrome bd biosynthesis fused ATPase/permease subunit
MPILFRGILKESGNEEWDESDEFYSVCLDGLRGIVTLKALNANEIHRKKVEEQAEINRKKIMQNLQRTTLNTRAIDLLISAGEFCFIGLGVWYATLSNLSNSHILMLFMIAGAWAEGAKRIFGAWLRGNKGISAFDRAAEILDAESPYSLAALEETENHGLMPFNDLTIVFDQVTFSYAVAAEPAHKGFLLQ